MKTFGKFLLFLSFAALLAIFGCCCASTPSTPSSGSCSLGTYGSACTDVCNKAKPGDSSCFTECMTGVRDAGLGDATTCCKQTFRQWCQTQCNQPGWDQQDISDCMNGECAGTINSLGISLDSCYLPI